ncbi:MAG: acetyl-coenzyme A synthetase, partial [Alphaproteobacteria bacterium]|nr:acetyl-coenzyme A synthetase [Alphaproteobacteria bacterium]
MSERTIYPVTAEAAAGAHVDAAAYEAMYRRSIEDPEGFWAEQARSLDWISPFTKVKDVSWAKQDLHIRWFHDGTLNASVNCLDRHLAARGEQTAIIWEGDDPALSEHITYRDLHERVCKFANVLKAKGVKR